MNHKQSQASPGSKEKEISGGHRHNFTVQVSLDEIGGTRQIVVNHLQSEEKKKWSGWKPGELIDFIAVHAGVQAPKIATPEIAEPAMQVPANAAAETQPGTITTNKQVPAGATSFGRARTFQLRSLEIVTFDVNSPAYVLRQGQPYSFRLTMDLPDAIAPGDVVWASRATIMAKQPGKLSQLAGLGRNTINPLDRSTTINVAGSDLPPGLYILEAKVTLTPEKKGHEQHLSTLAASVKGDLLEVLAT